MSEVNLKWKFVLLEGVRKLPFSAIKHENFFSLEFKNDCSLVVVLHKTSFFIRATEQEAKWIFDWISSKTENL